jgi:hypothetical protein
MAGKDDDKSSSGKTGKEETATIDLSHTSQKGADPKGVERKVIEPKETR